MGESSRILGREEEGEDWEVAIAKNREQEKKLLGFLRGRSLAKQVEVNRIEGFPFLYREESRMV